MALQFKNIRQTQWPTSVSIVSLGDLFALYHEYTRFEFEYFDSTCTLLSKYL